MRDNGYRVKQEAPKICRISCLHGSALYHLYWYVSTLPAEGQKRHRLRTSRDNTVQHPREQDQPLVLLTLYFVAPTSTILEQL